MVKVTDVKIDVPATVGNKLLLVDIKPRYEYDNNQRTSNITGYGYTVVLPDKAFEKLTVKIDGQQQMDITDGYVNVNFTDLELYIYWAQGQYTVGARATGIHTVNNKA